MLFAEIAAVSAVVAATSKRNEKTAALAELIGRLEPDEVAPAIGFLTGSIRQGRIGTGWRTVANVDWQPASAASLSILDVDAALSELQATTGSGSVARRKEILAAVLGRATEPEGEHVRGLLAGGIRQGALDGVVTASVAKAAGVTATLMRRAAMLSGDLGVAAEIAMRDGTAGLADVQLTVGIPVQPMLASTAEDVATAVEELGKVSVEWKLDGARIQVHRNGDEVLVVTRNLNDVTERLPEVVAVARSLPVESVVLDGETLALDEEARPRAFQDTMSRFGRDEDAGWEAMLQPWFFDIMELDGRSLIDEPLVDRLALLDRVVGEHRIPGSVTADVAEAERVQAEALELGHEGVMVKGADSTYEAGRRGKAWRKIKPVHTFDLVVLAAEWGHGRRTGWLSNLHLGARDPESGDFVMVGKTFKGLTDELLAWQTEQFLARRVDESGITVFVRPEMVVEIALDGVQVSTRYPGGVALRFARVKRYRDDKPAAEADTITALQQMRR